MRCCSCITSSIDHVTLEIVIVGGRGASGGSCAASAGVGAVSQPRGAGAGVCAQARAEAFFRSKLGDVDEPTAPFGLLDVHGDGSADRGGARAAASRRWRSALRAQARRLGVSAATLFHVAWALVVAHTSGRDDVVFGTVLFGRLQGSAGAQRIAGHVHQHAAAAAAAARGDGARSWWSTRSASWSSC